MALMCVASAWAGGEDEGGTAAARHNESSITIYGLIDQGIEYVNNVATDNITDHGFRTSPGTATSYFGLRGTEDLGEGLKAIWDLQGGFAANNGTSNQGGRLFGRQSYVGLSGRFGRLTFGRQYTMRFYATAPLNPFGAGSHGLTTLDNGYANARADNSIAYRYRIGGLEAGVNYSFGRDSVDGNSVVASNCPGTGSGKQCREWAAMVKYEASGWGVTTSYERQYGGNSDTYGGLTSPDLTDSRFILGGYFMVDDARIGVGWIRRTDEGSTTPRSNLIWVSAHAPVTANLSVDGMVAQIKYDDSADKALTLVLRGVYSLSKRTSIYVSADHIDNGGSLAFAATSASPKVEPPPGGSQTSVIAGIRHQF